MEERLGEGAVGVVYRAVHIGLEKSFAIKLLKTSGPPAPAALERFRREAVALGRLRHPHIVEVTDSGIDSSEGVPYIVTELLEGRPLSGPLPLAQALPLLDQIAGAIDAAHSAGVLHRDLKPGNVFVCASGAVKILDFGLAELLAGPASEGLPAGEVGPPELTATGSLQGTPLYAAPELIRYGEASRASDVYSFGVLAYEILGGRPPFRGSVAEVLNSHLEAEPPPLPLPPQVWRALREALRKDPALRPRTAGELVRRLREGAVQAEWARWKSVEVPRRIRIAALLAAVLAAVGLVLPWPPLPPVERRIGDWRVRTSPARAPDPRILLITFDEASLDSSPLSLADRADEVGRTLAGVFEAGAQGVAIDLLLPRKWSESPGFSELLLRHSRNLTLAVSSLPGGSVVGTECIDGLTAAALGAQQAFPLFGFVNLDEDRDGVIRRSRLWFRDHDGGRQPSWAARAARSLRPDLAWEGETPRSFWIDARIDWTRYSRISWGQVSTALHQSPGIFRDRLVLVGGDFRGSGDDYQRIPLTPVSELTLQALMADTILAGMPVREPGRGPVVAAAALAAGLAMAGFLCARRAGPTAAWLAAAAGLYLAVSFPVFWWTGLNASGHLSPAAAPARASCRDRPAPDALFSSGGPDFMRNLFILGLLLGVPAAAAEPVAIVYSLAGEAALTAPDPRPLRLFDRLPAGTTVEVGPGSRVALAFVNGLLYELGERSRVTIGKKGLASRTGPVKALSQVSPLPRLLPIAKGELPGLKAGAVRIRGEEITGLFPDGTAALADATILRFRRADGAVHYRVEIEDAHATVVFRIDAEASEIRVPSGTLASGAAYHWTVTALGTPGPVVRGEADFVTLSRKAATARERWRKAVETLEDGSAEALLKAVDHGLGLISAAETGVVVEHVTPASAGERAGLQPEDTILSWSCAASPPAFPQASGGAVRSPYDLLPLEVEEAPRRAVTLRGRRGGQAMTWTLTAAEWGIEVRPDLSSDLAGDARLAAWSLEWLAAKLDKAGKFPEADAAYEEAVTALNRETESMAAASLLLRWGLSFENRSAWNAAVERYESSLALARTLAPKSLLEARASNALGIVAAKRGDYLAAQELLQQALTIREELAPGTTEVTGSLNNLGILARHRGDLAAAERYLARTEEILRQLSPDSGDHALVFQNLGNLASDRGDLEKAERFHRQALAIFEKLEPAGDGVADCLFNLGIMAMRRGDLASADQLLRRSLALEERRAPDPLGISKTLFSLGIVASRRGDLETAQEHYYRALKIQEELSPDGPEVADSLASLGIVAGLQGDYSTARSHLQRVRELSEKLAPGSLDVAASLQLLGRLEIDSNGDLSAAEKLLRQALAIFEDKAPESLETAEVLRDLGEISVRRGRLTEAIALHRRALDLQRKLAPETTGEAEALYFLGRAERQAGLNEEGTHDLCQAIDVLDHQRTRIGGTQEARSSFESTLSDYYQGCLEGLIELGRPAEAFNALERGRARSFLALLAERDLRLSGLPPDLAAERRHLNAEYDRIQSQLARLSPARDGAEIERLTAEMRDLRTRQEDIVARMRRESPRSAAVEFPEPLAAADARAVLDPGTVLLEYAVGAERSWLFVVEPTTAGGPGLSVFPIPIQEKALREEVERFRRLLKRSGSDRATVHDQARHLYNLLVRPAQARLGGARRLLISADGPLHTLPFAALMRGDRYLVEWKPIHSVLSATVYAELARSRPARQESGELRLAAFGSPAYPRSALDDSADPELDEAVRRGLALQPLPSSRREVEAIAALYPNARVYLGQEAREETAKSLSPESRLVHFACHGLLDQRFPLNSALALTIPENPGDGQENGLLQAWEVFESIRLDADLVTLSACDSGLGKEMGGEGLLSLTRAFQYAGARSVLASLWSVADDSTADLMKRFYGYLQEGRSKDEALRAAQLDLIRSQDFSHPYYWAAFQLTGDWK